METHNESGTEAELKAVKETMEVLGKTFKSNSYGMLQCLFCVFGTASERELILISKKRQEQQKSINRFKSALIETLMTVENKTDQHMELFSSVPQQIRGSATNFWL